MFYVAFLVVWLHVEADMHPRIAVIKKFDTYKECMDVKALSSTQDGKLDCLLVVVEPKEGIKE